VRIYSTSGTTGAPSFVPLTRHDLAGWVRISSRSYFASGLKRGDFLLSTYNAGPFVAGAALDAFNELGVTHIPVGSGNSDRLINAIRLLKPTVMAMTPSYALHLAEWARGHGIDAAATSIARIMVAGEPGGGEPAMRAKLERAWNAKVTEAMGIGDIAVSLWGECPEQQGMHFGGRGLVHFELIEPETGEALPLSDGIKGELVYTHLDREAAPLLRFRSRDHVELWTGPCACGRTAPRIRCIGRTDDMLIVRGVNVFPTALREIVNAFQPDVSGVISVRPRQKGFRQDPPLKVMVELAEGVVGGTDLGERVRGRIREALLVNTEIVLAPYGSLPRSEYKSKLVDWSEA
jgi:phenylacetate-CoA ligase